MIRIALLITLALTACTCGDNEPVVTSYPPPVGTDIVTGPNDAGAVDAFVPRCNDVGCLPDRIACGYRNDAGEFEYIDICDCETADGHTVHCKAGG